MKLPSLTRLPNYRKFSFEPRYYDPIKEDIEERTSRIEQELRQRSLETSARSAGIHGAFARRSSYKKSSNMLQGIIMVALFVFIFGYLYFGNDIFYVFLLLGPAYMYFRLKQTAGKRRQSRT
ncbi:hypothetical protein [Tunicatimonas pelagia]|uniref:hypothetical protein n=1 Tax=Tunicatimonas pelagia TaxID=931531 RepID=UPI0026666096|nr:hypothetical protein [Tunicatimonas pelagia]WKN41615.1 hypothetical protein P0M28_21500 [Tunicatimonas pelagia]